MMLDRIELAWAAGFFDGEGSTTLYAKRRKSMEAVQQPTLTISQVNRENLLRFQRAVGGLGKLYGPYSTKIGRPQSCWRATRWLEAQAAIAMLWPFLGEEKREQALRCFKEYRRSISTGRMCRQGLHAKPRRYGKCKECVAESIRRWRQRPGVQERLRAYNQRYRDEHPESVTRWVEARREKRRTNGL